MRINDKNILTHFLKSRRELFENGVEDIKAVNQLLLEKIAAYDPNLIPASQEELLFTISSFMLHYREIVFFNEGSINQETFQYGIDLLNKALDADATMDNTIEDEHNLHPAVVATMLYALALCGMPFIRGTANDVYSYILRNNLYNQYFTAARETMRIFRRIRNLYFDVQIDFLCTSLEQEIYGVWYRYASENRISDSVFILFLNSDMRFIELEALNVEFLKDIQGLGDDWKDK